MFPICLTFWPQLLPSQCLHSFIRKIRADQLQGALYLQKSFLILWHLGFCPAISTNYIVFCNRHLFPYQKVWKVKEVINNILKAQSPSWKWLMRQYGLLHVTSVETLYFSRINRLNFYRKKKENSETFPPKQMQGIIT